MNRHDTWMQIDAHGALVWHRNGVEKKVTIKASIRITFENGTDPVLSIHAMGNEPVKLRLVNG